MRNFNGKSLLFVTTRDDALAVITLKSVAHVGPIAGVWGVWGVWGVNAPRICPTSNGGVGGGRNVLSKREGSDTVDQNLTTVEKLGFGGPLGRDTQMSIQAFGRVGTSPERNGSRKRSRVCRSGI